jgi:hypothetical protein
MPEIRRMHQPLVSVGEGLQHHRPGQIPPPGRDHDIRWPEPEPAGPRSSIAANTLGPSIRGRHIHSTLPLGATSADTSQSDRKP